MYPSQAGLYKFGDFFYFIVSINRIQRRRRTDAEAVVDGIIDSYGKITGAGNPNLVEFNGNRLLRLQQGHKSRGVVETVTTTKVPISMTEASPAAAIAAAAPRCGCAGLAVVSSLAVNRVQSTYSTPVYASRGGGVEDLHRKLWSGVVVPDDGVRNVSSAEASVVAVAAAGATIEGLAEMATGKVGKRCAERDVRMQGDPGFDGSAYRGLVYNSVHVGDLMFAAVGGATDDVPTDSIGCSDSGGGGGGGSCDSGKTEQAGRSNADTKPCSAADSSDATRNMRGDCVASSSSSAATATTAANYRMDTGGSAAAQTSSPVVTVLLPVKNGGVHLLDAVASVLDCAARSHELEGAMELLIVDDGSDDGAVSIAVAAARGQPVSDRFCFYVFVFCVWQPVQLVCGRVPLLCVDVSISFRVYCFDFVLGLDWIGLKFIWFDGGISHVFLGGGGEDILSNLKLLDYLSTKWANLGGASPSVVLARVAIEPFFSFRELLQF